MKSDANQNWFIEFPTIGYRWLFRVKKRQDLRKLHLLGARGELHNNLPKGDSDRPNFEQKKRCNSKGSILCAQLKIYTVSTLKTDAASNFVKLAFLFFLPLFQGLLGRSRTRRNYSGILVWIRLLHKECWSFSSLNLLAVNRFVQGPRPIAEKTKYISCTFLWPCVRVFLNPDL